MNPFKSENPFKDTTMQRQREIEEEEFLEQLSHAARWDPENKHGLWPNNPKGKIKC
ncbi:hypothetical protein HL13_gp67 [Dinoroseobacter phage DFL12phi1]|uniref:Uncharacterized protein n=1 Tax=Dinoroseobacter phage DFL12phi1 TaxID=1477404 RepID=A0A023NGG1_9CAUD|nr:hypothetical protein HL13_gp67 [Dinoroseobacter phage DFL12phi1]AHX01027.1 hypothetical protein DFL12P1_0067 [Dinoroseobacter phage DFL12phi1]